MSTTRRGRVVTRVPRVIPRFLKALRSYHYSRKELGDLRDWKLRRTVKHAYSYVPYYRALFRRLGLTPEDIRGESDLRKLPILTKDDIRRSCPDGLIAKGMRPEIVRVTSGTTGDAVKVAFSSEFMDVKACVEYRRLLNFGIRPWHRVVTIWDPAWRWRRLEAEDGSRHKTSQFKEVPLVTVLGRPIPQLRAIPAGTGGPRQEAELLAALEPDFIICRPTHLRRIGRALEETGLKVAPKALVCTNEVLTDTRAKELTAMFGAKTLRLLGGSESGPIGGECRFGNGIHLTDDQYTLEVVKDGEAVAPGEMGELVITHLHNPVMPLLRYAMGDFVELASEQGVCDCGSSFRRLKAVQGRVSDRPVAPDGRRLAQLPIADYLESQFGLRDFQLAQSAVSKFKLRLPEGKNVDLPTLEGIREHLEEVVGTPLELTTETRGENELWMKERPVVCSIRQ